MTAKKLKTIPVILKNNRSYNIYIGKNSLSDIGPLLSAKKVGSKTLIITQTPLLQYAETIKESLLTCQKTCDIIILPSGEKTKSLSTITSIIDTCLNKKLDRHDTIIACGGGVIGDTVGFAAAIYLRGIHLVQIPTSLLAQVDAAIGGKTGVNHPKGKNLIGSFKQPLFVCIDQQTLQTLPKREVLCGLAEIVKYSIIQDNQLYSYIKSNQKNIAKLTPHKHPEIWTHLIEKSAEIKAKIVEKDETEQNIRAILNYGHTIGHGIETAYNYTTFHHGEGVALGMKAANHIALNHGLLSKDVYQDIETLLSTLGFTHTISKTKVSDILKSIQTDKKIKDGKQHFILPKDIGHVVIQADIPTTLVKKAIGSLCK